jgi:hypothetical protein
MAFGFPRAVTGDFPLDVACGVEVVDVLDVGGCGGGVRWMDMDFGTGGLLLLSRGEPAMSVGVTDFRVMDVVVLLVALVAAAVFSTGGVR